MILEDMSYEELLNFAKRFVVRPVKDFEEIKAGQDYIINQDEYYVYLCDIDTGFTETILTYEEAEQCLN